MLRYQPTYYYQVVMVSVEILCAVVQGKKKNYRHIRDPPYFRAIFGPFRAFFLPIYGQSCSYSDTSYGDNILHIF